MATAWSISRIKGAKLPTIGTEAITTDESIEIRVDLDHFPSQRTLFDEIEKLIGEIRVNAEPQGLLAK